MSANNRLIIIGNGFDLAHGLRTGYRHFIDWYSCQIFENVKKSGGYSNPLITIKNRYAGAVPAFTMQPTSLEEVLQQFTFGNHRSVSYNSTFFGRLVQSFTAKSWVDIEREYFHLLSQIFTNPNYKSKSDHALKLNGDFDFLTNKLIEYLTLIDASLPSVQPLSMNAHSGNFRNIFRTSSANVQIKVLNFNYTDTVSAKGYISESDIIHIHGHLSNLKGNPIIFGYGDETNPVYQQMEDSGENVYLEHIKSFGYFKTTNYDAMLSFIDARPFEVYIVGHSCGLSDRVLLNTVFEHDNCKRIRVFYHKRADGTDNFTELTQEISRHFKPQNKDLFRRRVAPQDHASFIPQRTL